MNAFDDHDRSPGAALAAQIHAARTRCAYSIETLSRIAEVPPSVVVAMEQGAMIRDLPAVDRVMAVLGLHLRNHLQSGNG